MLKADGKHVTTLQEFDENDETVIRSAMISTDNLKEVPSDQQESAKGAKLLLLATVLHHYNGNEDMDTEVLEVSFSYDQTTLGF